jgi:hypothetical protein
LLLLFGINLQQRSHSGPALYPLRVVKTLGPCLQKCVVMRIG